MSIHWFNSKQLIRGSIGIAAAALGTVAVATEAIARSAGAGVGYSSQTDVSYCSTYLTSQDTGSRINVREGPGTNFSAQHYGLTNDWVDILNRNGNPSNWMSAQDGQGFTWYQVGFPSSRAYGWVRSDFVSIPPAQCRN